MYPGLQTESVLYTDRIQDPSPPSTVRGPKPPSSAPAGQYILLYSLWKPQHTFSASEQCCQYTTDWLNGCLDDWYTDTLISEAVCVCVCVFSDRWINVQMILITEPSWWLLHWMSVSCVLFHSSANSAPGEITALLDDAVIGSRGEDALHSLVSTALITRLCSIFLKLLLPRKLFFCPWYFVCLPVSRISHKPYEQIAWNVVYWSQV